MRVVPFLRRLQAPATVTAIVLGTLAAGIPPAVAGTSTASIDIRDVSFTETGQLLVEGSVECVEGSILSPIADGSPSTWMAISQTVDGTYLYSEQRDFDDQVVCDGTTHAWQLLFDGHDDRTTGQPFVEGQPLAVVGQAPFQPPVNRRPGYLIDVWEEFIVNGMKSREPLRVDVTDVRYTAIGAVVVEATVKCPTGYVPAQNPEIGLAATRMQLEQWYVKTEGDTVTTFPRNSRPKTFEDQIVCDGTVHALSVRFAYAEDRSEGRRRFKAAHPIHVSTDVNIAKGDTHIRAYHDEEFVGTS